MAAFASNAPLRHGRVRGRGLYVRASATCDSGPASVAPAAASLSRRAVLLALCGAAGATLLPSAAALAADAATEEVTSEQFGYSYRAPAAGWTRSSASLSGFRTLTAFTRDADESGATNVSMVETPVSGDFMKLTSFGPLDSVLKTIVPDGRGGVSGEVISARQDSAKNAYVVEYKLKAGADQPMRHLVTVFSLQPGRYLLTLTAQTTEDQWEAESKVLREVAESYKIRYLD